MPGITVKDIPEDLLGRYCGRSGKGGDCGAQGRIRGQDTVIPMALQARRGDEGGEPVGVFMGKLLSP